MSRPDHHTHTEADAAAYDAAHDDTTAYEYAVECGYDPADETLTPGRRSMR